MSLSAQAIAVLTTVTQNENTQATAKYAGDLAVYNSVTVPNWIAANMQSRNLVMNVNFTPSPVPTPPAKTVYTLNTDTGEITSKDVIDTTIPPPVLPPYVSAGGNAFANLQPTLSSQEQDLNTSTLQNIWVGVQKIMKALNLT